MPGAFDRQGVGIDDPRYNMAIVLRWLVLYGLSFAPAVILGLALRRRGLHRPVIAVAVFAIVSLFLVRNLRSIDWGNVARPLPIVALGLAIVSGRAVLANVGDASAGARHGLRLTMSVFALVLLGKIILNARIHHYGFVLAMPATLLLVLVMLDWVPRPVERAGGYGAIPRAAAVAVLVVAIVAHLRVTRYWFDGKSHRVGRAGDAFMADARGPIVQGAVDEISGRVALDETLAALPEAAMLNYLARRRSSTPFTFLHPPEVAYLGEERVLAALEARPPDYVALVHFDSSEHGYRFFGRDYALRIGAWVQRNYRSVALSGGAPLEGSWFGIRLVQRLDQSPVP